MQQKPQAVGRIKLEIATNRHYRRVIRANHSRANCSEDDIKAFLANRETVFCTHVAAHVTEDACREFRKTLARVERGEEAYFDAGPLKQCLHCPNRRGAPPVTMADVQVKVIALALIGEEWASRKARGLA